MKPGREGSIFETSDTELNYIVINLDVTSDDGVFSVITMTDFSDLNIFMELSDVGHKIIAVEKTNMLDQVNNNNAPTLNNDEGSATVTQGSYDMLHSIEIPELKRGKYRLRLGLPKAYWMKQ